jgi:hypothetical protein
VARSRTGLLGALLALSLTLGPAPAAHADAFGRIYNDYQSSGKIDACKYTEAQLKQAKSQVPNDIEAYAPDFPNALQAALELRAGGACTKKSQAGGSPATGGTAPPAGSTPTTPTTATQPAAPGSTVTPGPTPDATAAAALKDQAIAKTAQNARNSDAGAPAPVVALGVLGALLVLGGLLYGLTHWLAFDPPWIQRLRHAVAEAGWRAGNTWSEFTDWVRLGR